MAKHRDSAPTPPEAPRIVSVIDVGSTAIRMVVAEINADSSWTRVDRASRPLSLGRDVFISGFLSTESMRDAVAILKGFKELLAGWKIQPDDVRVIATAAIREAKNRDTFLDRVQIRTGFRIDIVEGIEENHLTYIAVQHAINDLRPQFARSSSMILEVGGGTTEIMLLQRGRMVAAHSLRIGTLRVEQQVQPNMPDNDRIEEYLRENIRVNREVLNTELRLDRVKFFIAVGGDARIAAARVGHKEGEHFSMIDRERFDGFLRDLQRRSMEECVRELKLTYTEVEGLVPALLTYKLFMDATSADQLIVPDVSIREGVLLNFAAGNRTGMREEFSKQVLNSTIGIGRKYHFDESHGMHVAKLAVSLFDQFAAEHGMDDHGRLLLEVSGIIHDIGNFIRASGHHKHGQYIVENSEIFGLSRSDIRIVANVVRYHRGGAPATGHTAYASLRREHRMLVLKLAAMLRVADALDRGHVQRVRGFRVEKREEEVILRCDYSGDISIEEYGLRLKGRMFEEVFGYGVMAV
ncbi:MAG: HD domain-containing protein [Spirochaeta sp.]|jgi:exopolyphosphatase/guanosine-5'-triphosphate,3'-diphosphate pyrophosphatase|nr:HD domain-containing protein [Spirochaeta sp.]